MNDQVRDVVTPIGVIEVSITLGDDIPENIIDFTPTGVKYRFSEVPSKIVTVHIAIDDSELITLRPDTYEMWGFFGSISSDHITVTLISGLVEKLNFHFGEKR